MLSSDKELLISINGEIQSLKAETRQIRDIVTELRQDKDALTARLTKIEDQLSDLKGYINTWFTVIAVVVAVIGGIAPLLQKKDSPPIITI